MIRILASSHHFRRVAEGDALESLDARMAAVCRERYRRIDRFVQLALVGAGECAAKVAPAEGCGLYLASAVGSIGSNVQLQDAIQRDRKLPMPFAFVNTLGSSACFHVAKDLSLSIEAVLVARESGSFTAALRCALADLHAGIVSQVLIGAVEECVLPVSRHRVLLRQEDTHTVAEGSHWMLAELATDEGAHERVHVSDDELDDASFTGYAGADAARITAFLSRNSSAKFGLKLSRENKPTLLRLT